jgi:hypothetical protein
MARFHSGCVIRASEEALFADISPAAEKGRHSTIRDARFKLIAIHAFRQKGFHHRPTVRDWSIGMEVKRHPRTAPYGPESAFHDAYRDIAHLSDVRLDFKSLNSAVPGLCVDVIKRSQLARV